MDKRKEQRRKHMRNKLSQFYSSIQDDNNEPKKYRVKVGGEDKRISEDNYVRPKRTKNDLLQKKSEIVKKLEGYKELDNTNVIPRGSVRYITIKKGKKGKWKERFYIGGYLKYEGGVYVVLSNGKVSWSVQKRVVDKKDKINYKTRFFVKKEPAQEPMTKEVLRNKLEVSEEVVVKQQAEIEKLKKKIIKMSK